jgi:Helix-turn-helix domain
MDYVTKEDLQTFRLQLLEDIKLLLADPSIHSDKKNWLKNKDVKALLGISNSSLARLRQSGQLVSTKIGGSHYYRLSDIHQLLPSTRS